MIPRLCPCLLLLVAGCNLAGALAYKVAGPPKVQAKYTPAKTPMLVLAENPRQRSSASVDADLIARYLREELDRNEVAPQVEAEKLVALRDARGPDFGKLSITSIGRELGAQQVLYVQLTHNSLSTMVGDNSVQGSATARVKVIDVTSGQTLWPTVLEDGAELSASTVVGKEQSISAMEVRQRIYRDLASQIARLFYAWQPEDMRPDSYSN